MISKYIFIQDSIENIGVSIEEFTSNVLKNYNSIFILD